MWKSQFTVNGYTFRACTAARFRPGRRPARPDLGIGIRAMVISPDHRLVVCSLDGHAVRVLQLSDGKEAHELKGYGSATAFSPDGNSFFASDEKGIQRLDVSTWKGTRLQKTRNSVDSLAVSPDGMVLVAGLDNGQLLWIDTQSGELLEKTVTTAQIAEVDVFLKGLESIGWFELLPKELRDGIDRRAREEPLTPGAPWEVLSILWQDSECVDDEGVYAGLIAELAEVSGGLFKPEEITEKWNRKKEEITVGFTHGGQSFRRVLDYQGDCLDPAVFELVNKALAKSGTSLQFMPLPGEGQDFSIILATPALMKTAQEKGLIPREKS